MGQPEVRPKQMCGSSLIFTAVDQAQNKVGKIDRAGARVGALARTVEVFFYSARLRW